MKLLPAECRGVSRPISSSSSASLKHEVNMSLFQLQELASRQQEQIESTHRMILNKEQRLNYLASVQEGQQAPIYDYDQNFIHFKEKISAQECKLRKLRQLKSQIQKQRCANSNICSELETVKVSYKEKERELSMAMGKIEALTKQLDELKKGNISNSYNMKGYKHVAEIDKLRQELLYKSKLCKQNEEEMIYKRNLLYKRQSDMMKIDQRICELQTRLSRKRQLNQQLSNSQTPNGGILRDSSNDPLYSPKSFLRSSIGPSGYIKVPSYSRNHHLMTNIATVEPIPRYKANIMEFDCSANQSQHQSINFVNKQDSKYQTLPYNTKFIARGKNYSLKTPTTVNTDYGRSNGHLADSSCDNRGSGSGGSSSLASDISLIISSSKSDSKDNSLEERPSPSGSSGSSDRISSSLTTYSYNDKLSLNNLKNHYFENGFVNRNESDHHHLYSSQQQYVPNGPLSNSADQLDKSTTPSTLPTSSCLDKFYKTKPAAPVKPIENGDTVDRAAALDTKNFIQRLHSINDAQIGDQPAKANSIPEQQLKESNNQSNSQNDEDNSKNRQIEQRSSVSEIVNKLNNWSVTHTFDWEKLKRRPVMASNEMEDELRQDAANDEQQSLSGKEPTSTVASVNNNNPSDGNNNEQAQDVNNNANNRTVSEESETIEENNANTTTTTMTRTKQQTNPLKRLKGSLKSKDKVGKHQPLGRRVSFDPLALLLDASLEGELELVKRTSAEVPNPSASNDEGITALHNATCAGHIDIVKYLVEIGCDVNVQDSDGWTPLHCAASCNNLVMIKFLVKSGACIFATTFSDHETAAEKCEEDEEGFDGCSQYLYGIQEKLGLLNNGIVYTLYDYESQNFDELSFKNGTCIQVLRKGDDQEKEWWWSKIDDKEGYIPRNLIGLYPRIKSTY